MNLLPVAPAHVLEQQKNESRWLVEGLWSEQAVGIIGGEPKCCKSFMALTLSVAVASGAPCLGTFTVPARGRVLYFPAEDALPVVKRRLEGICAAEGLDLRKLPLFVVTAPVLRLDTETDRGRLRNTVEKIRPSLLVLDPFVRLHGIDENASSEVAKLLAHLRQLQRSFGVAVAVVHHAKKGAARMRAGQALRGSSEFHAWGDSNLYLRRDSAEKLTLSVEHRSEGTREAIPIEPAALEGCAHLRIASRPVSDEKKPAEPRELITGILTRSPQPLRMRELREQSGIRNSTVSDVVNSLCLDGTVVLTPRGYQLAAQHRFPDLAP